MKKGGHPAARTTAETSEAVIYATAVEAVPVNEPVYANVPVGRGPTTVPAQGVAMPSEQAICRGWRASFYRDPRFNDCEADYYRCESCRARKGDAIAGIIFDTCVVS